MKKSRFAKPQIIKIPSEQDKRKSVSDICQAHGISPPFTTGRVSTQE